MAFIKYYNKLYIIHLLLDHFKTEQRTNEQQYYALKIHHHKIQNFIEINFHKKKT